MSHLTDDLNVLHDRYVESVNIAVAADDLDRVQALTAQFDDEVAELISLEDGPTAALIHRLMPRRAA